MVLTLLLPSLGSPKLLCVKNPTLPLGTGPRDVETIVFTLMPSMEARNVMFGAGTTFVLTMLKLLVDTLVYSVDVRKLLDMCALWLTSV